MPNTEVKLTNAESTWPEAAREDRKLLIKEKTLTNVGVFFHLPGLPIRPRLYGMESLWISWVHPERSEI